MAQLRDRDEFFLDVRAVRRSFDAASATYEAASGVQAEILSRHLERLDLVRLDPAVVLDVGAGAGAGTRALKNRYPRAQVVAFDLSVRMLAAAARRQGFLRRFHRTAGDTQRLPFRDASVDLIFSNLALEWCADPDAVFHEFRRVLRPNGLLTFTTLGPDTLKELRTAWREVDAYIHVHRFIDMHDIGDALVRARFAEPVMDVERLTITYAGLEALHRELKASGSRNLASGRPTGLTGRGRGRAFSAALTRTMRDGRLPVSVEVVYGHAWAGESRRRALTGETLVPVAELRRRSSR